MKSFWIQLSWSCQNSYMMVKEEWKVAYHQKGFYSLEIMKSMHMTSIWPSIWQTWLVLYSCIYIGKYCERAVSSMSWFSGTFSLRTLSKEDWRSKKYKAEILKKYRSVNITFLFLQWWHFCSHFVPRK